MSETKFPEAGGRPEATREYSGPWSTLGLASFLILTVGTLVWWLEFRDRGSPSIVDDAPGIVSLPPELNPTGRPPEAAPGRAAPAFELRSLDGQSIQLTSLRGRMVLLNFWASWCGPCRAEAPDLDALAAAAPGHLVVLGVNQQEPPDTAQAFVDEFSLAYPTVLDRNGEVSRAYRVGRGLPVSFLIDAEGVILAVYPGRLQPSDLEEIREEAGL